MTTKDHNSPHQYEEKVRFIHLRNIDDEGDITNSGGVTVAFCEKDRHLWFAYSRCHWNDNYCKRIGRNIATGRLYSGDCYAIANDPQVDKYEAIIAKVFQLVRRDQEKSPNFFHDEE
jgi:hypothetical protein